ncbi:MAG: metallophosphoesterase [Planctomycetes bacterium]|nr:metallophosphoesterase [Planctomycetota bacterium]
MVDNGLVQPLFEGSVDVIGDIHGEIDALRALLRHLGYDNDGVHPEGRRLIFLGDLTDRGPNSPAVVRLIGRLLDDGLAQGVMGNHDLNLLLGEKKHGNAWFFGRREALDASGRLVPQALADDETRTLTLRLFRRLPLVLERDDLRIVHACWHGPSIEAVRQGPEENAVELFRRHQTRINDELERLSRGEVGVEEFLVSVGMSSDEAAALFVCRGTDAGAGVLRDAMLDKVGRGLVHQNANPVKRLLSGPERRVAVPFWSAGKHRHEERVPWWDRYGDKAWSVFGHYSRVDLPGEEERPFDQARPYAGLGNGRALCIDYSVTRRWQERFAGGPYRTALAALRWPERWLYFDSGRPVPLPGERGV